MSANATKMIIIYAAPVVAFDKICFGIARQMPDGSPFRDGGATPCSSFYYADTLGL